MSVYRDSGLVSAPPGERGGTREFCGVAARHVHQLPPVVADVVEDVLDGFEDRAGVGRLGLFQQVDHTLEGQ